MCYAKVLSQTVQEELWLTTIKRISVETPRVPARRNPVESIAAHRVKAPAKPSRSTATADIPSAAVISNKADPQISTDYTDYELGRIVE